MSGAKKVKPKYFTKIGTVPWGVCVFPREPVVGETVEIVDADKKKFRVVITRTLFDMGRICVDLT